MSTSINFPDTIPAWLDGHADELSGEQVGQLVRQRAWFTERGMPGAEADEMTAGMVADVRDHTALQQQQADVPVPWWAAGSSTDGWQEGSDGVVHREWSVATWPGVTEPGRHGVARREHVGVEVLGSQAADGTAAVHVVVVADEPVHLSADAAFGLIDQLGQAAERAATIARGRGGAVTTTAHAALGTGPLSGR